MRRYTHDCSLSSREGDDRAVFLLTFGDRLRVVDSGAHSNFCRLQMSDFLYSVGESLLGDDKYTTTGDITYITTSIVSVGYKVYYTLDITQFPC